MPHVYRHIRLDTNMPFYVGIGQDDTLIRAYEDRKGRRSDWWLRIAKKYGFSVDILFEDISIKEAKKKEIEFIQIYGREDLRTGTLINQTDGGDGCNGWKADDGTREKMSKAAKIRGTSMLNTPEIIEKRANSMRGKKRNAEQIERLAAWQRGIPKSKDLIQKMVATKMLPENVEKSRNQPNCKKVVCLETGIIYRSAAEASRQLNIHRSSISMVCLGIHKKANNLTFKFN
jgi:hypothetical protein